jgi:hypothetical protein
LYLSALGAYSQNLSGSVSSDNLSPVAYAHVYIKGTTIGTFSDEQGLFSLDLSNLDMRQKYTLVARHLGYKVWEGNLHPNSKQSINISLMPKKVILDTLILVGDRKVKQEKIGFVKQRKSEGVFEFGAWDTNRSFIKIMMPAVEYEEEFYLSSLNVQVATLSELSQNDSYFMILCEIHDLLNEEPLHISPFVLNCNTQPSLVSIPINQNSIKLPREGVIVYLTCVGYVNEETGEIMPGSVGLPAAVNKSKKHVTWTRRSPDDPWEESEIFFQKNALQVWLELEN